jgi:hypothetical protein
MAVNASLLALARAEMHRAKHWRIGRMCAHVVTLLLAISGLIVSNGTATYLLAAGAVASEVTAWTMRYLAKAHHDRAERGLRAAEQRKHLDPAAAAGIEAEIVGSVSDWARKHTDRFDARRERVLVLASVPVGQPVGGRRRRGSPRNCRRTAPGACSG